MKKEKIKRNPKYDHLVPYFWKKGQSGNPKGRALGHKFSVRADSTLVFRVTFDENVTGVNQTDFETSANASVTGITANSATQYDVTVTISADGTVSLGLISTGHGIADTALTPNTLTDITPINDSQTYTVTLEPDTNLTWQNDVNVSIIDNTLTKTSPDNSWG